MEITDLLNVIQARATWAPSVYALSIKAFVKPLIDRANLVRPAGLEPATPRFEVWCSIR